MSLSQKPTMERLLDEQFTNRERDRHPKIPLLVESSRSVHSVTKDEKPEELLPGEAIHEDVEQHELPKMWGLDDPFLYAPPKLDRDPWSILLEPLMEKDKIPCDAWKDEVQNLLIFAGLFSAVVTAFIIESYKTLQPDPNDTIITLLSVIATRQDCTNSTLVFPYTSHSSSFSPTMSSIRINSFWFISLVLSLTTVLVGIISLQWIREHQNYPRMSPRETYALFNMRAEGLEKWHIPKIFTALPLLLQGALVLFLGGIIDFLLAFGDIVVIPVSIFIGLVLLFLIATTVLPTLQSLLLCLPYPYSRGSNIPPAQCPYKSPQAHALRVLLCSTIRLCSIFFPRYFLSIADPVSRHTWMTWFKRTWTEFDVAWLRLRNTFVQSFYRRLSTKHDYFDDAYPIYDLIQGLMASVQRRDTDLIPNTFPAQYHCFTDLSKYVTDRITGPFGIEVSVHLEDNAYLRDVMTDNHVDCSAVLSYFFDIDTYPESQDHSNRRISFNNKQIPKELLHQENILLFFQYLGYYRPLFEVAHMMEIEARFSTIIMDKENYELHAVPLKSGWTRCLVQYTSFPVHHRAGGVRHDSILWQWVNHFSKFVQGAAHAQAPYTLGGTLHTNSSVVDYLARSAQIDLNEIFDMTEGLGPAIKRKFLEIFEFINDNLNEQMSSPDFHEPTVLFYVAALYLCAIRRSGHRGPDIPFHPSLGNLLLTIRTFKRRTIDAGIVHLGLQEIYHSESDRYRNPTDPAGFSAKWWGFLVDPSVRDDSTSTKSMAFIGDLEAIPPLSV